MVWDLEDLDSEPLFKRIATVPLTGFDQFHFSWHCALRTYFINNTLLSMTQVQEQFHFVRDGLHSQSAWGVSLSLAVCQGL